MWKARPYGRRSGSSGRPATWTCSREVEEAVVPWAARAENSAALSGSAADDEQSDDEDEHDELEGDAYGVLEVALQTGVADGDPCAEESSPPTTRSTPSEIGTTRLTTAAAPKSRKATPSRTRR